MSASHARVALAAAEGAFARVYVHAGMVNYHGEKMSKSLGNLVFVSRLVADGVDPMAIRMALLAHHYRSDWEWTDAVLGDADARLARWRAALARAEAAVPEPVPPVAVPVAVPQPPSPEIGQATPASAADRWCWPGCAPASATTSTPLVRSPSWTAGPIPCWPNPRPASLRGSCCRPAVRCPSSLHRRSPAGPGRRGCSGPR